jgi:hypothetical protein
LDDAKKGIRWLIMMSEQSVSARKAWEIFDGLIRMVAPMIRWSVYDMPAEAPVPPGYNYGRFDTPDPASEFQDGQQSQMAEADILQFPGTTSTGSTSTWGVQETQNYPPPFSATYTTAPAQYELASNPLDNSAAVQRFFTMGQLHGHYDDPWQQIFSIVAPTEHMDLVSPDCDMMQGQVDPSLQDQTERVFVHSGSTSYEQQQNF